MLFRAERADDLLQAVDLARNYELDAVLVGESELSFRKLVQLVLAGKGARRSTAELRTVPGIVFREGGEIVRTETELTEDIDRFGMPAWDLTRPADNPTAPHGAFARHYPVAPILTSRGCPYSCGFCSVPQVVSQRIRYRSKELVASELRVLRDRFGVREFQIVDDNFTIDRHRARAICEHIVRQGLAMPWTCPNGVRVDALDDDLLDAMKRAGCYSISLGIESGSEQVLGRMVKHLDLAIRLPGHLARILPPPLNQNTSRLSGVPISKPCC